MNSQTALSIKYRFEKAPVVKRPMSNAIERFGSLARQAIQFSPALIPSLTFGRAEKITDGLLDPGLIAYQPRFEPQPEQVRLRCIEDQSGPLVEYHYDKEGKIKEVILLDSFSEKYAWSDEGKLLSVSGCDLKITQFKYRKDGLLSSINYPDGSLFKYGHDETCRLSSITYPDGILVNFVRDANGQLTLAECRDGTFGLTWDDTGSLQSVRFRCAAGDWSFMSDESRRKLRIRLYLQRLGSVYSTASALGLWRFDVSGSPFEMFTPACERMVKRIYEERKEIVSWCGEGQTTYRLDKRGVLMGILTSNGTQVAFKRLPSKRSVLLLSLYGVGLLNYDEHGRLRTDRDQSGRGALYKYTSDRNLKSVDSMGKMLSMTWTESDNLKKVEIGKHFRGSIARKDGHPEQVDLLSDCPTRVGTALNLIGILWNWESLILARRLSDPVLKG